MKKRKLLKEHFKDYQKINGRKSRQKIWFDLCLFRLTGEYKATPFGVYYVYYSINRYNPLIYLFIILLFIFSIFRGGIIDVAKEIKTEWKMKEKLEIRTSIYDKYLDRKDNEEKP